MNTSKAIGLILFASFAGLAPSTASRRAPALQQALPPPQVHQGVPPSELDGADRGSSTWWHDAGIKAIMRYRMEPQEVVISWTHNGGSLGAQNGAVERQRIALPYHPTCAIRYDEEHILIAGKIRGGRTLIEKLQIAAPVVKQDNVTGEIILSGARVLKREYLYGSATLGRDMVHFMKKMITPEKDLLIRFWDSKDIYRLNAGDNSLHMVASSTAGQAGLHIPEADAPYVNARIGVHVELGNVYIYHEAAGANYKKPMVPIDSDGDGVVESSLVPDLEDWRAYGFGKAASYHDW